MSYFKEVNLYNQHFRHYSDPAIRKEIDTQHVFCTAVSKDLLVNMKPETEWDPIKSQG